MTPVDALDTMILMGLKDEARTTREYVATHLSFEKDISVQNFEITIRLLGGLLSSYELTRDKRLLTLAEDLGNRLLPVFNSPTGLPYRYVNLKTGAVRGNVTNPAEAGTLLIEFGTLAKLTHRQIFFDKAKRALVEIYQRRSPIGLVGTWINVETGEWTDTDSHISGAIDSYYEYLLKCAILFNDQDCRRMWNESLNAINGYLLDSRSNEVRVIANRGPDPLTGIQPALWYGHADMNTGKRKATIYGALDAFFPAVLALSGHLDDAIMLQDSSFTMWNLEGIEPEEFDYQTRRITSPAYPLRPEIVESAYYLYHYTLSPTRHISPRAGADHERTYYQQMGQTMWRNFVKYCRHDVGYAALQSVVTKEKSDSMQSFVFAETFKYFYLLFAPPQTLDFDRVIFNTEAHPIRKQWPPTTTAAKN
jgi:mannosidase alpha-like ER degradation enhancer 2